MQRGALAVLLAGVLVTGVVAARIDADSCRGSQKQCATVGIVRWSRPLAGSWIAQDGVEGTVFSQGQAAVAAGHGVAVIGYGLNVSAYDLATGLPRWSASLAGLPAGSAIVSIRAWRGVVTAGVSPAGPAGPAGARSARLEVVLRSVTGRQIRTYPAAAAGGAVMAGPRRTVIVGPTSVASYVDATGRAVWRDPTGPAAQAWRVADRKLYVTVAAGGAIGTAPVTAVRQIDLRNGAERLIRPPRHSFDGMLTGVIGGDLVFSGSAGLSLYSIANGYLTGQRARAVAEAADPVQRVLYADIAGVLTGIDPVTGRNKPPGALPAVPPGVYGVRAGVALGLDPGSDGSAWGYSMARRQVIWSAKALPWPHYFAEISGLGGSVDPQSGTVLLATCGQTGQPVRGTVVGGGGRTCLRPRLVAIGPSGGA